MKVEIYSIQGNLEAALENAKELQMIDPEVRTTSCFLHFYHKLDITIPKSTSSISGPKGLLQINDRFDCTSTNMIYCISCALCNKLYIRETGRRLGDRFREHLLDIRNNSKDITKPVARHFNLPGHIA